MNENKVDSLFERIEPYLIVVVIASFVGVLCGVFGFLLVFILDKVVSFNSTWKYLVFLMPFVGLFIVWLNRKCGVSFEDDLYKVVKSNDKKSFSIGLIISTCLSQVVGASVGRFEFPIRISKQIGEVVSDVFDLVKERRNTIIACTIAGFLSATFGAVITSSVIACELFQRDLKKRRLFYFPVIISAIFSRFISFAFGTNSFLDRIIYVNYASVKFSEIFSLVSIIFLCLIFAILFNKIFDFIRSMFALIKNEYIRMFVGSLFVVFPIYFLGNLFYGNNPDLIKYVISSNEMWYSFFAKAILTFVCLAIGFKGGKIAPSFVSGACLGILLANLTGISPMIGAAVGGISVFCVVTNLYVSPVVLGIEVFGIVCAPVYIFIVFVLYCLRKANYLDRKVIGECK